AAAARGPQPVPAHARAQVPPPGGLSGRLFRMYNPRLMPNTRKPMLAAFRLLAATVLACLSLAAHAQLSIEITGAGASRFPVVIPVFENEARLPRGVTDVVRADPERSGLFTLIDIGPLPLPESVVPDFAGMRGRGADAVLTGSLIPQANGSYDVRFRLFDTQRQLELGAMS